MDTILSLLQAASTALEAAKNLMEKLPQTPPPQQPQAQQAPMKAEENWESASDGWPVEQLNFDATFVPVAEAEVAAEVAEAEPPAPAKIWSVHDCHTHLKGKSKGIWAREAVANGTYGICVGPTPGSKDSANEKILGPLGEVTISKRRWKNAKGISVGDMLFMGDTHAKKVFKGVVTAQPVNGPFCPQESLTNSFIANLSDRKAGDEAALAREVEVAFTVGWNEVGPLTEEWYKYLGTGRLVTVSPLTAAPPA